MVQASTKSPAALDELCAANETYRETSSLCKEPCSQGCVPQKRSICCASAKQSFRIARSPDCTKIHMSLCTFVLTYTYVYTHTHKHTPKHPYPHTHPRTHTHTYTYTHTNTHTHTHTQTHTQTHARTHTSDNSLHQHTHIMNNVHIIL